MGCLKLAYRTDYTALKVVQGGLYGSEKSCAGSYRYGFNGKEKVDDVYGGGDWYSFEFREYDSRIGRFTTIDPLTAKYPWQSPYAFAANSPIMLVDVMGLGPGDPPITAYHNTSVESAAEILKDGFKSGKSGWNFFMTNPSGKAAGSEVANAPVQIETSINVEGAQKISYKQWSGFFRFSAESPAPGTLRNKGMNSDDKKREAKSRSGV